LVAALFFSGWMITRGANMQKFAFKRNPTQKTFLYGLIPQRTVPGTRILCSGWWGIARHFNYAGEILQGLALALPGLWTAPAISFSSPSSLYSLIPLLYPLYYCVLFVTRQLDDEEVCRKKYGAKWEEYTKAVPYRIFPGIW
jgi:delta14-sterol reductase